jgi:hypothetical protein
MRMHSLCHKIKHVEGEEEAYMGYGASCAIGAGFTSIGVILVLYILLVIVTVGWGI